MVNLVLHCGARHVERSAVEEADTPRLGDLGADAPSSAVGTGRVHARWPAA